MLVKLLEKPADTRPAESASANRRGLKVAYVMSRFPKLTETFVLGEILALERLGFQVEVYPLRREQAKVIHPEAQRVVERAHFTPWFSWAIFTANVYYLLRRPRGYFSTLWVLLRRNFGSLRFFAGAMLFFPKAVYFARRMAAERVAHLHAHFCSHPAACAYVVHRLAGISFSFTAHGTDLHCDRHMLREKVAAADFVVAISQYNRDLILAECGPRHADKVTVIHCGVDTDKFQPRTRPTPFDQGHGPLQIVCVGTLHEVKGQTYLIDACGLLRNRQIDFQCHLIGEGPDRARLEAQAARLAISDRVHFHGCRPTHEVAARLAGADVLVAPSVPTANGQREGIPVVLMEAMAGGLPVVTSRLSGIPELVSDGVNGLLTAPGDAVALADALLRLHGDRELRRRLGQAGREKVLAEFNRTSNAAALAQRFCDIARTSHPISTHLGL